MDHSYSPRRQPPPLGAAQKAKLAAHHTWESRKRAAYDVAIAAFKAGEAAEGLRLQGIAREIEAEEPSIF